MRSLEQPRQSREYLAKLMTKVFLLEDVQQQRRRVAALSTKSSASLILIQKLLSPDRGITYDLAHATAGYHGCSARHRPCCYTACSGNHFSDALWDACFVTFSDAVLGGRTESCHFHSSVVQSRIAPPQTSQRIQAPNAGVVIAALGCKSAVVEHWRTVSGHVRQFPRLPEPWTQAGLNVDFRRCPGHSCGGAVGSTSEGEWSVSMKTCVHAGGTRHGVLSMHIRQLFFLCEMLGIVLAFERRQCSHFGVLTQIRHVCKWHSSAPSLDSP